MREEILGTKPSKKYLPRLSQGGNGNGAKSPGGGFRGDGNVKRNKGRPSRPDPQFLIFLLYEKKEGPTHFWVGPAPLGAIES